MDGWSINKKPPAPELTEQQAMDVHLQEVWPWIDGLSASVVGRQFLKPLTTKDTKVHEGNPQDLLRDTSCPWWFNDFADRYETARILSAILRLPSIQGHLLIQIIRT